MVTVVTLVLLWFLRPWLLQTNRTNEFTREPKDQAAVRVEWFGSVSGNLEP